jgi:hypothetical protein
MRAGKVKSDGDGEVVAAPVASIAKRRVIEPLASNASSSFER